MRYRTRNTALIVCLTLLLPLLGCAQQAAKVSLEAILDDADQSNTAADTDVALVSGGAVQAETSPSEAKANRKIIYTADVHLVVKEFAEFERQITSLIGSHGGFAAERSTDRTHGNHRGGRWEIRVPVENYDRFLSGLSSLGFARSRSETSDDVTEAYVDLQARISNKRELEERIIEMLKERPGKLADLMEIERELSRVREEIERMEGRMRVLVDQTSLATVRLQVVEETTYQPPAAPTLGDRIANAWTGSIQAIGSIGSGLVILAVGIAPWLVIVIPIAAIGYRIRHRLHTVIAKP